MKQILLIIFIITSSFSHSQITSIVLPENGIDKFDTEKKHYTIHITQNEEFFFNKKKILFWSQISSLILEEIRTPKLNAVENIIIYADKNISDYYIIERLRFEIGKVWQGYLHYMSKESSSGNNCLSFYIKSSFLKQKQYDESDWIYGHDIIFTNNQRYFKEDINMSKLKSSIQFPVFAVWQPYFSEIFFERRFSRTKDFLKQAKYTSVTVESDTTFYHNNKVFPISDNNYIEKITKANDILFVKANIGVSYMKYYKTISAFQDKRYKEKNHGVIRKPFIMVIPSVYEEELKENGINIFD